MTIFTHDRAAQAITVDLSTPRHRPGDDLRPRRTRIADFDVDLVDQSETDAESVQLFARLVHLFGHLNLLALRIRAISCYPSSVSFLMGSSRSLRLTMVQVAAADFEVQLFCIDPRTSHTRLLAAQPAPAAELLDVTFDLVDGLL